MKRYLFSIVVLASFAALHGAALTQHLAASAVAQCSFATPGPVIRDVYCLPSQEGDTAVCFDDIRSMVQYDTASEQPSVLQDIKALLGISLQVPAPVGSCTVSSGRSIKSPHDITCISTEASDEKLCFDQPVFCSTARPAYPVIACFENQLQLSEYQDLQAAKIRSDWDLFLSRYASVLPQCSDSDFKTRHLDARVCPLEHESLTAYVSRIFTIARVESVYTTGFVAKQDLLREDGLFWQLPWTVQRFLACAMIEAEYINSRDARSTWPLLACAAQNKDEEAIFWLWDKDVRAVNSLTPLFIRIYLMMLKSNDVRSIQVLQSMVDEEMEFQATGLSGWTCFDWALELEPAHVLQKLDVITKSSSLKKIMAEVYWNDYIVRKRLKKGTPGAQALGLWCEHNLSGGVQLCQIQ